MDSRIADAKERKYKLVVKNLGRKEDENDDNDKKEIEKRRKIKKKGKI